MLAELQKEAGNAGRDRPALRTAVGAWAASCLRGTADPARFAASRSRGGPSHGPAANGGFRSVHTTAGSPARRSRASPRRGLRSERRPGRRPGGQHPVEVALPTPASTAGKADRPPSADLGPHRWPATAGIGMPRLGRAGAERLRVRLKRGLGDPRLSCRWTGSRRGRRHGISDADAFAQISACSASRRAESSREAFGAIALSAPPDGVSLAEVFAHETQHVKAVRARCSRPHLLRHR